MNLDQAVKNIDTVLANANMNRGQHIELDSNLKLLVGRAKLADKLEQEAKDCDKKKEEVK